MILINIINDYKLKLSYKNELIDNIINHLLISEKIKKASISIILTNQDYLSQLKKEYFNLDQFTDVIAFNLEDKNESIDGEVYISIDNVLENSNTFKTSFNNEFLRVLIHGVLHLIGYNDDNKKNIKIMRALEDKYLLNSSEEVISIKC